MTEQGVYFICELRSRGCRKALSRAAIAVLGVSAVLLTLVACSSEAESPNFWANKNAGTGAQAGTGAVEGRQRAEKQGRQAAEKQGRQAAEKQGRQAASHSFRRTALERRSAPWQRRSKPVYDELLQLAKRTNPSSHRSRCSERRYSIWSSSRWPSPGSSATAGCRTTSSTTAFTGALARSSVMRTTSSPHERSRCECQQPPDSPGRAGSRRATPAATLIVPGGGAARIAVTARSAGSGSTAVIEQTTIEQPTIRQSAPGASVWIRCHARSLLAGLPRRARRVDAVVHADPTFAVLPRLTTHVLATIRHAMLRRNVAHLPRLALSARAPQ
jgi:hypothetical protein